MIAAVRTWLLAIITVSMAVSLTELLLPSGTLRRMISMIGGLILLLVMLQPILHLHLETLDWDISTYRSAVESRTEELESEHTKALSEGIAAQTEAYISDKARQLGLECTVHVTVETETDGMTYPVLSAVLDCAYQETLASYMEEILGISKERQSWNETKAGT